jgi:hypothetical protein
LSQIYHFFVTIGYSIVKISINLYPIMVMQTTRTIETICMILSSLIILNANFMLPVIWNDIPIIRIIPNKKGINTFIL